MLLRAALGAALRRERIHQKRSLRAVASGAGVSLGYLSEVERGHKEMSSELLVAVAAELNVPVDVFLVAAAAEMAAVAAAQVSCQPSVTALPTHLGCVPQQRIPAA